MDQWQHQDKVLPPHPASLLPPFRLSPSGPKMAVADPVTTSRQDKVQQKTRQPSLPYVSSSF